MILAVDSSARSVSAALFKDGTVIGEFFLNAGLTHCETLVPMIDDMLRRSKVDIDEIDCYAVSVGPGSFTGIRIGVCTVKGLAAPRSVPCVGISTLEAIAMGTIDLHGVACCVMDARRGQVYNALFRMQNGRAIRLCEDRAVSIDDLETELQKFDEPVFFVGDGADLCYNRLRNKNRYQTVSAALKLQTAVGVALAAVDKISNGQVVSPDKLVPVYLRPSQAERERKERMQNNSEVLK